MQTINTLTDGQNADSVYLVKTVSIGTTRNGKQYMSVTFQDQTGTVEGKVWDPNSYFIAQDVEPGDFVQVLGMVKLYNGALQINVQEMRKANKGEYAQEDFFPASQRDKGEMLSELSGLIASVQNPFLSELLDAFFKDAGFLMAFCTHSAAKTIHHSFVGGLMEHTLSVANLCDFLSGRYPAINRDLLITAALLHDVGKVWELSPFPANDYTEDGAMRGHISIGAEAIHDQIEKIPGFPKPMATALIHCILAHHGKLEWGSPVAPCLIEAQALHMADDMDAKLEGFTEALASMPEGTMTIPKSRMGASVRKTVIADEA